MLMVGWAASKAATSAARALACPGGRLSHNTSRAGAGVNVAVGRGGSVGVGADVELGRAAGVAGGGVGVTRAQARVSSQTSVNTKRDRNLISASGKGEPGCVDSRSSRRPPLSPPRSSDLLR